MNRDKITYIITICLAFILALLIVHRLTPGGQRSRVGDATTPATIAPPSDLRSDLQQSLATAVSRALTTAVPSSPTNRPLPRDPFALHLPAEMQAAQREWSPDQRNQMEVLQTEQLPIEERVQLKATVIDGYGKLAFINDQVVTEGQTIAGYMLIHIGAGFIVLARDGDVVHLRLHDGGKL
jgi:hypothetical protein